MRHIENCEGFQIHHDDSREPSYDRYYAYEIDGKKKFGPDERHAVKKKIRAFRRRQARPKRERIQVPVHWVEIRNEQREVVNGFFRRVNGTSGNLTLQEVDGGKSSLGQTLLFPATLFSQDIVERYVQLLDTRDEIAREIEAIEKLGYRTPHLYAANRDHAVKQEKSIAENLERKAVDMEAYTNDE